MPFMSTAKWRHEIIVEGDKMVERLNDMGLKYAGLNESGLKETEPLQCIFVFFANGTQSLYSVLFFFQ